MNKTFQKLIKENTPKINKKIVDGTAKAVLSTIPQYLDNFFKSGLEALNPKIDFKYIGYRKITPKEEFKFIINSRDAAVRYDLSHSNVYPVEFMFEYKGKPISRIIYLPYAERGNLLTMGGANYHVTPVLSDTVFSPSERGVFVRLLKAKLNFSAKNRYFIINGEKIAGNVIYGDILKPNQKQIVDNIGKPIPATSLYLLGKYGLKQTLYKYGNIEDVIVTTQDIEPEDYPDYRVYESTKVKPRGLKATPYIPHNVKILVKGENINKDFVDNLIFGVIYTLDILPEIEKDAVKLINQNNLELEQSFWRIILGRVIYKNSFSIERITQDLEEHYIALEGYVDAIIKAKLETAGIYVNDFFDLLAYLLTNYNKWVLTSKEYTSNIENRYIDMLYYLTYDIIIGFNRVILGLNKRITKTNDISYREVNKLLSIELTTRKVYTLTKTTERNLAISLVDYSGDIMYPKITSLLEDQSRGNGVKMGRKSTLPESAKTLKGGDLGFGSLLFLGKNLPSPRFKANMFMDYDIDSGKIKYPPDIQKSLEKLNAMLQGMEGDSKIVDSELDSGDIDKSDVL